MIIVVFTVGLLVGLLLGGITMYAIMLQSVGEANEHLEREQKRNAELVEMIEWQFVALFNWR